MKREENRCVSVDGGKPVCVSRNKKDDVLLWRRKSIILSLKTGIEQVKIFFRYITSSRKYTWYTALMHITLLTRVYTNLI
jgi:hypothetical protein